MSAEAGEPALRRTLGRRDIALLTVGNVIGSGIFLVPGTVVTASGMNVWMAMGIWATGAALALCGALTYARLAESRPEAGGVYIYIRDAFGRTAGFLFGWMMLFVGISGAIATLASAFARIVSRLFVLPIGPTAIGLLVVLAIALANCASVRRSGDVQNWTALFKLLPLIAIAILLLVLPLPTHAVAVVGGALQAPTGINISVALIAVLWAFEGWQYVTYNAGEVTNPGRTIRFGLVAGVVILGIAYMLITLAVSLWLPPAELASAPNVIEAALRAANLNLIANTISVIVLVAILSAAHATLLSGSRLVYAMAVDGFLPHALARLSVRTRVPLPAVLLCAIIAAILTALGSFDALLGYVVVTSWLFYGLAGLAVFRLTPAGEGQSFGIGVKIAAALFAAGALLVMVSALFTGPPSARYGLMIVAVGWIAARAWFHWRDRQQPA
jgi:APA family basic amino acid/polyamine antiporter